MLYEYYMLILQYYLSLRTVGISLHFLYFCYTSRMQFDKITLRLLGLNTNETKILDAIYYGHETPLQIQISTRISRPTIYDIIKKLHARGLVRSTIRNGKKYWVPSKTIDLDKRLFEVRKTLFGFDEGVEEVHTPSESTVTIHRGKEAIRTLIRSIFTEHKQSRLYGIQGDMVSIGWNKVFGVAGTNELNRLVKKNDMIVEALLPKEWCERQTQIMGKEWAQDFQGRMSIAHEIDEKYFDHGGQIFIFKHSLYLIAMNEEIIVEVRNSEIQKIILSMFHFIQDNGRKFDINTALQNLITQHEMEK